MNKNLNSSFWNKIKTLIKLYHLNFLFDTIGGEYLSEDEINFLEDNLGKSKLDSSKIPLLDKIFAFGQVAQKIGLENANKITKKDLEDWLKENKIKVTAQLEKIKAQAYLDVLSKQFQIEKDLRQGVLNEANKKEFKMSDVVEYIKSKFEDWAYLKNTISYVSESALNEGKIEEIKSQAGKEGEADPLVYKVVIEDNKLCPHCRKAYCNNDGSPRLFRLSELVANGTNIGKKPNAWLPTLGMMHPHCYDKETEVLTDKGWKFFKDLTGEELCLTFDIETENVKWSPILNRISYLYNGPMHLYENSSFSLCVTPEHNQVVEKRKMLNNKRFWSKPILIKSNELSGKSRSSDFRFLTSISNYIGEDKSTIDICGKIFNTEDFVQFLAFYLAEGSINGKNWLYISQHKGNFYKDIYNLSVLCFGENFVSQYDNAIGVKIENQKLFNWFCNLGNSYTKYIPNEIKSLGKRYLNLFLDRYIDGDGNRYLSKAENNHFFTGNKYNYEQIRIFTSSYKMAADLSEIIMKLNKSVSIKEKFQKDTWQKVKGYLLNIKKYTKSSPCKKIIDYNDYVYCVEVQDNHTLFVKRGKDITISGNCRCLLQYMEQIPGTTLSDYEFNEEKQRYILREKDLNKTRKVERKSRVKIDIGSKHFEV